MLEVSSVCMMGVSEKAAWGWVEDDSKSNPATLRAV